MRTLYVDGKSYTKANRMIVNEYPFDCSNLRAMAALCCKSVMALRIEHAAYIKAFKHQDPRNPLVVTARLLGQPLRAHWLHTGHYCRVQHPRLIEFADRCGKASGTNYWQTFVTQQYVDIFDSIFGEWIDTSQLKIRGH